MTDTETRLVTSQARLPIFIHGHGALAPDATASVADSPQVRELLGRGLATTAVAAADEPAEVCEHEAHHHRSAPRARRHKPQTKSSDQSEHAREED